MDIKQCANARAVVTIGKDMTFRDYAQGSFRMRGIGKGQTITLYIIPEVENRIEDDLGRTVGLLTTDPALWHVNVAAWLMANSFRMEGLQFLQLNIQELANIWRKRALNSLVGESNDTRARGRINNSSARVRRFVGRGNSSKILKHSIGEFREFLTNIVEGTLPEQRRFSDIVEDTVQVS